MKIRDSQQSKVYKAEREAFEGTCTSQVTTNVQRFDKPKAVDRYANKVMSSSWTKKNFPRASRPLTVNTNKKYGCAYGNYWSTKITLPPWAWKNWVILHEIAHVLDNEGAAHGPFFCVVYLKLVKHFMGKEAFLALKQAFRANRVKLRRTKIGGVTKKREYTPEQLEVLRERVRKAREVRMAKKQDLAQNLFGAK